MPNLDQEILRAIRDLPGIAVLVVFGSRARGNHRPDSDLDVAVLPDTQDSRARRYLQGDLAAALAHLSPEGRVDVILIDEAPETLRQAVMETGRVLLDRDPEAWKELRVRTMREYGDSESYRRLREVRDQRELSSRLSTLESYLAELRSFRSYPREQFVKEPALHHLAERYLHLACEAVLDAYEEEIIDRDLSRRLQRWMGFRNVLVHLYLEIDHGRVYDAIQEDLGDLEAFAASMARFLQ